MSGSYFFETGRKAVASLGLFPSRWKRNSLQPPLQLSCAMGKKSKKEKKSSSEVSSSSKSSSDKDKKKKKKKSKTPETTTDRPTILCWLMQRQKFEDAMERLHDAPDEASTWLVDESTNTRSLPLHLACRQLRTEEDNRQRIALSDLVSHLLLVHPKAAQEKDSPDGRLPIHDAIAGGIDEETLALLLTVYPESMNVPDERRLTLIEINRLNTNSHEIQSVLDLGYDEWKMAYDASPLASGVSLSRMDDLMSVASGASKGTSGPEPRVAVVEEEDYSEEQDDTEEADDVAYADPSLDDTSPEDDDTVSSLGSLDETHFDTTGGEATIEYEEEEDIPVVSWDRVKDRALALEKILSDMKEENYSLHEKIQRLSSDDGLNIIIQVDRNQGTDLYGMVDMLQHQNFSLDQNIYKTETLLHYSVFPADDESIGRQRRRGEVAQMLGWLDDKQDTGVGETLQQIQDELKSSYDQQLAAIAQFGFVFDLIGEAGGTEAGNESLSARRSVVSNLTMNDDDWSDSGDEDESRPARSSGQVMVEIEWPQDEVDACAVSDNLSSIFRHASGADDDEDDDENLFGDSAMDNLSQILQDAAAKDKHRKKIEEANRTNKAGKKSKSKKKVVAKKKKDGSSANPQELVIPALAFDAPEAIEVVQSTQGSTSDSQGIDPSTHTYTDVSDGSRAVFRKKNTPLMDKIDTLSKAGSASTGHRSVSDGTAQGSHSGTRYSSEYDYYADYRDQSSNPKEQSAISFGTVSVRVFDRILGDNPGCGTGPSMGIGWVFVPQDDRSVDAYEKMRRKVRDPSKLLLSREERENVLGNLGYTSREIAINVRELNKIRSQRRQTIVNLGVAKMEERVESARRVVKSVLLLGRKKKLTQSLSSGSTQSTSSLSKDNVSAPGSANSSRRSGASSRKSSVKPPVKTINSTDAKEGPRRRSVGSFGTQSQQSF